MTSYVPALLWAGLLLFIGGQSNVPTVETDLPADKAAHFVLYGILGVLATLGWVRAGQKPDLRLVLILAALVGVADELRQRYVPNRESDAKDWVADAAGIAAAATLIVRYKKPNAV
jgi:VanZ family protein